MNCLVSLTKTIETPSAALNHQAMGWALGVLTQQFEKDLFRVQSLEVENTGSEVRVTALVHVNFAAKEGEEQAALDEYLSLIMKSYFPACCYSQGSLRLWGWDSAEAMECNDGKETSF